MSQIVMKIDVEANFRYLWLKYVTGANLDQHCARGLSGSYSKALKNKPGEQIITIDEHQAKVIYLCGVSAPYKWDKNFHLAMIHSPGDNIDYESNGIKVTISNAKRIEFEGYDARTLSSNPNKDKREFHTCRNWIFANYATVNGLL